MDVARTDKTILIKNLGTMHCKNQNYNKIRLLFKWVLLACLRALALSGNKKILSKKNDIIRWQRFISVIYTLTTYDLRPQKRKKQNKLETKNASKRQTRGSM